MVWRHIKVSDVLIGWCAERFLVDAPEDVDYWATTDKLAQQFPIAYISQDDPNRVTEDFWGGGIAYPCTVVLRDRYGKATGRKRMERDMLRFLVRLNYNAEPNSLRNACNIESGIFNGQPEFDWTNIDLIAEEDLPKPEPITTAGNFVAVIDQNTTGIRIATLPREEVVDARKFNYANCALVVHKFQAIHRDMDNSFVKISSPTGVPSMVYNPVVEQVEGYDWIAFKDDYTKHRIEFLPDPGVTTFYPKWNIPVRTKPSILGTKVGYREKGKGFKIWHYYPTDTGLWAKLFSGEYLALGYQPRAGSNYTAWSTNFQLDSWMPIRE